METIPNKPNKPVASRPKVTTPADDRYIAVVGKRNRRSVSTSGAFMFAAAIGKTISVPTLHQRLHLNSLYSRAPRV
ncbi:HTH_Tnp_Tc3_2 domain-containing protein [Trichonephila clavipes]|nr:HTH_Tnp_Tc3_2 domain-containing protein [Trichonephila clavipes]